MSQIEFLDDPGSYRNMQMSGRNAPKKEKTKSKLALAAVCFALAAGVIYFFVLDRQQRSTKVKDLTDKDMYELPLELRDFINSKNNQ